MTNSNPTPEELQRIDLGETNYSDQEWEFCDSCNGAGEDRYGMQCGFCKGKGEISIKKGESVDKQYRMTLYEWLKNEINLCVKASKHACNGQIQNDFMIKKSAYQNVLDNMSIADAEKVVNVFKV